MSEKFHLPILSSYDLGLFRTMGPGLGNLLFPIARALIGAELEGGIFVAPTLRQLKIGPIIRNEPDKRIYSNIFKHRSFENWKHRAKTIYLPRFAENDEPRNIGSYTKTYAGLGNYFHDLAGHEELIKNWLWKNARLSGELDEPYDIALHIRLGDFSKASADSGAGHSVRQSYEWYHGALDMAIKHLGLQNTTPRIMLFTDENPNIIRNEFGLDAIQLDPSKNALTAISNMSKARCIVTSRSTFTMWAAYLGQTTAIWNPQMDLANSFPIRHELDLFF